jgi:hypothetical protein
LGNYFPDLVRYNGMKNTSMATIVQNTCSEHFFCSIYC